ncbi:hypothetical protein [Myxosarcina sp. GI1]|uniref:hypothetical protein n=1 Tax=Myxosarcina sp. GI1 TaxID=1541065 RepID=UPI000563B18E|nr:hypothetical protein [Myxosarcina sp. GI1]
MDRLEKCPLNETCKKSQDRFYGKLKGTKSCSNFINCRILSAAWKLPMQRRYDLHGQYWEVDITPIVCEWRDACYEHPRETDYPHCPVEFFSKSHLEIGCWLERYLPCPTALDLVARERLGLDEIIAIEVKQAYQRRGFLQAVSLEKKDKIENLEKLKS